MKYLDGVILIKDKDKYNKENIYKGMNGVIIEPEIRFGTYLVVFSEKNTGEDIATLAVDIDDLELFFESDISDDVIKDGLTPGFPVKVENGFIYDTEGNKVNDIAYDYHSYYKNEKKE